MSLFRTGQPLITLLFKECLGEIVAGQPDLMIGLAIQLAAEQAQMPCPDLDAVAHRLMLDAQKETPPRQSGGKNKGYGAQYTAWLNKLKTDELCLWLADYDPQRARVLYCETDMDLVKALLEVKTAHVWQDLRTRFEACLLGFGGELKGQNETVHDVDMSDTSSVDAMIERMKKLGF